MASPTKKLAAVLAAFMLVGCASGPESGKTGKSEPEINEQSQEVDLTDFQEAALMGGTLLAEGRDGCPYIRRAAELMKKDQGQAGVIAATAKEIVQTHGPRCGVR